MRDCRVLHSRADQQKLSGVGRPGLWLSSALVAGLSLFVMSSFAAAQAGGDTPLVQADGADGGAPVTNMGGGDFFSQELGTIFRLRYSTESYGQDEQGNFDIGTMQVTNFDDATAFFDGQVTVNEQQGVGFNLGLGYRFMSETPFAIEPERITGVSLWADGTDTKGGDFFPQVGVSLESLGEMWDVRLNGYIPLGARTKTGSFASTGVIGFAGNNIVDATVADQHTSFDVAELEFARRMGSDRDAWLFAGPYVLANEDDSSAGWKVGVRGYAYPDLLLQFAVNQDDIFHTHAAFSLTWFVGRTRTNFQPACGLPDRMREPVMRNDYVALSKTIIHSGNPLTDTVSGEAFNVVHVDSNAAPGGNGTFEHPLNNVANVEANSQPGKLVNIVNGVNTPTPGSIILLHANSTFNGATGASGTLVLQDNQRLLGEGDNMKFFVSTKQHGTIPIPESSPGARAGAVPIILNGLGNPIVKLADTNEVANFTINGGPGAGIGPGTNGAGNPNIHDMTIENTTAQGIVLTPLVRDNDGNPGTPQKTVAFNVTLNKLTFNNVGGDDIAIDATPPGGITIPDPNVTLQEAMALSNINSTNGHGRGILISNTHTGGTETISSFNHDGGTTSADALEFEMAAGTATVNTSTFIGGNGAAGRGVFIDSSTGSFTFADTVTFSGLSGGAVAMSNNTAGTVMFQGGITNTPVANANSIELTNNTGQDINFNGNLKLTTTGTGKAFTATGGGTLTVTGTDNELTSANGSALEIKGMTLSTAGATFHKVNSNTTTGGPGINLVNNTGGPITVGDTTAMAGNTGTITNTMGDAIVINDSANVSIHGLIVNNLGGGAGVHVTKDTATTTQTVNLGDLTINDGTTGVQVNGAATAGNLTMTLADSNINHPVTNGLLFDTVDHVSQAIAVNNVKIDGNSGVTPTTTTGINIQNSNAGITFDSATTVQNIAAGGTSFEVNGGTTGTITDNGTITNATATAVEVQGRTGGAVTFSPTSTITATGGRGLNVHDNTAGTVTFQGTNSLHTTTQNAVTLTNNTGASVTLAGLEIQTTAGGQGFNATGGGTLEVDGTTNTISTTGGGTGLRIDGMTIAAAGANFKSVSVDGGGTGSTGIVLNNDTGGAITIGVTGSTTGQGGTIQNTLHDAIDITNTANAVLNGVTVLNAGTAAGDNAILLKHNSAAAMSVTMNNTQIGNPTGPVPTLHNGLHINGTGGSGTFNVTTTGGTTRANENGLEVEGAVTTINDSDNITNTVAAGHSINIHNLTAGTVNHTGTVADTGGGVAISNNTGGTTNLQGTYNLNTGANDAVTITGNTAPANIQLAGLNIDTTTGRGFVATGGGTLTVNGTTNTIDVTGAALSGLDIENMTIGGTGVNFQHVNAAGTTNGIILTNLTGGQVTIGNAGGAVGTGGTLSTTGDAVVITNAQNVALHDLHVTGGANAVNIQQTNTATTADVITIDGLNVDTAITAIGVNVLANSSNNFTVRLENSTINKNVLISDTGSGTFGLLVDNTDVTSTGTTVAFDMELSSAAHLGNLVFRNGDTFLAGDASSLLINSAGATAKTVNLSVDGTGVPNTFTNASATNFAANFLSQGGTTFNATIQGNSFDNGTAPTKDFNMGIGTSTARVLLNLGGVSSNVQNTATGVGGSFILDNTAAGIFNVFDKANTITVPTFNSGTVTPLPNAAAIGNSVTPPTPPTAP
jgi:hypothetical protein